MGANEAGSPGYEATHCPLLWLCPSPIDPLVVSPLSTGGAVPLHGIPLPGSADLEAHLPRPPQRLGGFCVGRIAVKSLVPGIHGLLALP